jgi:hypothetical protein
LVLDRNDVMLVHVGHGEEPYPTDGTSPWSPAHGDGAIHHVALNCSKYNKLRDKLMQRPDLNNYRTVSREAPNRR